ncbi:MAG: radical SAM family heme chaperone HemW [Alphaproteobacteria bacterium]|nr:radical SAM family heme chaperone HemW [Alphaproteobacteria bacterium]
MAGIYLHIPFCKQRCSYCNFHFTTNLNKSYELIEAMIKELVLKSKLFQTETISTIYLGGGTPSILNRLLIEKLVNTIYNNYTIETQKLEFTLEANPEDLIEDNLKFWKQIGINRLSIGVQSMHPETLQWFNRCHTVKQANLGIEKSTQYFDNFNLDLIYGIPIQHHNQLITTTQQILNFKPTHISSYCLTIESKTHLKHVLKQNPQLIPTEQFQIEQYNIVRTLLGQQGYMHYEVSNFSLNCFESKHNSAYWLGKPYLGIGPSAHSYIYPNRFWNISHNQKYIADINQNKSYYQKETLNTHQQFNEYIMFALRTKRGGSFDFIEQHFSKTLAEETLQKLSKLDPNDISIESDYFRLTPQGWLLSDAIASDLFKV